MSEPIWIAVELVLEIHDEQLEMLGGLQGTHENKLLSALARAENLYVYADEKPDIAALAAAYAYGIARNHPFADANKRTAFVVCATFLRCNGIKLSAKFDDMYDTVIKLAAGEITEEELADWIRNNCQAYLP